MLIYSSLTNFSWQKVTTHDCIIGFLGEAASTAVFPFAKRSEVAFLLGFLHSTLV